MAIECSVIRPMGLAIDSDGRAIFSFEQSPILRGRSEPTIMPGMSHTEMHIAV